MIIGIVICVQTLAPTTGSGQFTNDVVNLKHQGAGQKLMIGWHKHQGVSETPKSADVICEQPLTSEPQQSPPAFILHTLTPALRL